MAKKKVKLGVVGDNEIDQQPVQIPKPGEKPSLNKFKSKSAATIGGVETMLTGLPHHSISDARDFVRLHEDEANYWSDELCFVSVPIVGQKKDTLHPDRRGYRYAIPAELAHPAVSAGARDQAQRLVFLCHVRSRNLDNQWNETSLDGCEGKNPLGAGDQSAGGGLRILQDHLRQGSRRILSRIGLAQSLIELILRTLPTGARLRMQNIRGCCVSSARGRNCREVFDQVVVLDFEYRDRGRRIAEHLVHGCVRVGPEPPTRTHHSFMAGKFGREPPFDVGPDTLVVATAPGPR